MARLSPRVIPLRISSKIRSKRVVSRIFPPPSPSASSPKSSGWRIRSNGRVAPTTFPAIHWFSSLRIPCKVVNNGNEGGGRRIAYPIPPLLSSTGSFQLESSRSPTPSTIQRGFQLRKRPPLLPSKRWNHRCSSVFLVYTATRRLKDYAFHPLCGRVCRFGWEEEGKGDILWIRLYPRTFAFFFRIVK